MHTHMIELTLDRQLQLYDVYYIIRLYMQSDTFTTNLKVPRKVVV